MPEHIVGATERDLIGYGRRPPRAPWPDDARIAISLVLNYEEGSEQTISDGDERSEAVGEVERAQLPGARDLAMESTYEYGSRVGVWRLLGLFERHRVPATVFATAVALERNPAVAEYLRTADHEIASHGYRWEEVWRLHPEIEREHIRLAVESLTHTVGRRPVGWYCRYGPSEHTRGLLVEEGGFEYDSDSYADDLPYFVEVSGQPWCVVPYAFDANDMKFWRAPSFGNGDEFYAYLRDSFDWLYREGAETPRMLSVGLHCRTSGRPGRAAGLERFLRYAQSHDQVWFARRMDIARVWKSAFLIETPRSPAPREL